MATTTTLTVTVAYTPNEVDERNGIAAGDWINQGTVEAVAEAVYDALSGWVDVENALVVSVSGMSPNGALQATFGGPDDIK